MTRDEYNAQEWAKFEAGTKGADPVDLKCSSKDCEGDITDKYPGHVVYNGVAPETRVQCDGCGFEGWRLKLNQEIGNG